jgi:hypothetical protein
MAFDAPALRDVVTARDFRESGPAHLSKPDAFEDEELGDAHGDATVRDNEGRSHLRRNNAGGNVNETNTYS